ncbi:MAG: redoxin domain-containing protein [Patescibacteria group bacterium]
MKYRPLLLRLALIAIIGTIAYIEFKKPAHLTSKEGQQVAIDTSSGLAEEKAKKYSVAREITDPEGFINVDSITMSELIGKKVILLDFWTYSCINCQRTLPYLTSWYEKYRDEGLEIVSIHTPEFAFERKIENVQWAVDKWNIKYPVVLDNDYGTWFAYENRYWPRKYLIDIDGFIVYDHIGEGGYAETELKIQDLLKERRERLNEKAAISSGTVNPAGVEVSRAQSPETYFGSARNTNLGNGKPLSGGITIFEAPQTIRQNLLYLDGEWIVTEEESTNRRADARIIYQYGAQKVFLVMSAAGGNIMEVRRDDQPLDPSIAGEDIYFENGNSYVRVQEERLYRLIEDQTPGTHTLELIIRDPGLNAYAFTFG